MQPSHAQPSKNMKPIASCACSEADDGFSELEAAPFFIVSPASPAKRQRVRAHFITSGFSPRAPPFSAEVSENYG